MIIYFYDEITKVFTKSDFSQHDMFNMQEFLIPDNATTIEPPTYDYKHIPQFADGEWILIENHMGEKQVEIATKQISVVDYYGDAKDGFQFVTLEEADDIIHNPDNYGVVENKLQNITNTTAWKKRNALKVAEELIEYTYERKANRAYGGVVVKKDDVLAIFETMQDSFASVLATLSFMDDEQTVSWKFYVNDIPTFIEISKAELHTIAKFGRDMITACFNVEREFDTKVKNASYKELNSNEWVEQYKADLENALNTISNLLNI